MTEQNKEEERRAELMDNLPCGAGIYEYEKGKLRCRYLNKRYWELVGRSSYDFEMKSFFDVVQLEDRYICSELFRRAFCMTEIWSVISISKTEMINIYLFI